MAGMKFDLAGCQIVDDDGNPYTVTVNRTTTDWSKVIERVKLDRACEGKHDWTVSTVENGTIEVPCAKCGLMATFHITLTHADD